MKLGWDSLNQAAIARAPTMTTNGRSHHSGSVRRKYQYCRRKRIDPPLTRVAGGVTANGVVGTMGRLLGDGFLGSSGAGRLFRESPTQRDRIAPPSTGTKQPVIPLARAEA